MEVARIWKNALDALFPIYCLGCGAEGEWVCTHCLTRLIPAPLFSCAQCGKASVMGDTHDRCSGVTALSRRIALYPYGNPFVRDLIKTYKYHEVRAIEPIIRALTVSALGGVETLLPHGATVIAMPLHKSRMIERGFNQVDVIARAVAVQTNGTMADALTRKRRTDHQAELPDEERKENCVNAFVSEPITGEVILVDDVVTSGATMQEAAQALKSAGAHRITCLALAYGT